MENQSCPRDIIIADLARPSLSQEQKAALSFGDNNPVDLSEKAVLDSARARTGLSDFGSDDFLVRLNLLLGEWNADSALSNFQRMVLFGYVTRYASNRLSIQDMLKRHPEIHHQVIDRPVIVAGLPRSGTTHLVNLLAADSRFHSLPPLGEL